MANPSKGLGRGLAALLGDDVMTPRRGENQPVPAHFPSRELCFPATEAV